MPNFLPSRVQTRTRHGELDNRFQLRRRSEREEGFIFSILAYSLKRNERARRRTSLFSNFLLPLAVSIPKVGCSLIAFLPSVECGWHCLFVEHSDTPLSQRRRLGLLRQLACARQRRLIGCWWTQTGIWHLPVALTDEGFRCPFSSDAPFLQSFHGVSLLCLFWPLLFSISPSLLPRLGHLFCAPSLPPSSFFFGILFLIVPTGHLHAICVCSTPDFLTCCVAGPCWVLRGTPPRYWLLPGTKWISIFSLLLASPLPSPLPFTVLSGSFLSLLSDSLLVHLLHFVLSR